MSWATVLPSRAPFHHGGADQRQGLGVVQLQAARLAPFRQQGGREDQQLVFFTRSQFHVVSLNTLMDPLVQPQMPAERGV
jgi:hypothetical protein